MAWTQVRDGRFDVVSRESSRTMSSAAADGGEAIGAITVTNSNRDTSPRRAHITTFPGDLDALHPGKAERCEEFPKGAEKVPRGILRSQPSDSWALGLQGIRTPRVPSVDWHMPCAARRSHSDFQEPAIAIQNAAIRGDIAAVTPTAEAGAVRHA